MKKSSTSAGTKRLAAYLPANLKIALNRHVDEGLQLRQAWLSSISEPLASHAHPVRYEAGVLIIHADTAAWASRLRHQYSTFISALRRNYALRDMTDLRVRVVPRSTDAPSPTRARSRLSATAGRIIERTADAITDPDLRAALRRLAQQGESPVPKRSR
jgi:hypothetical protein